MSKTSAYSTIIVIGGIIGMVSLFLEWSHVGYVPWEEAIEPFFKGPSEWIDMVLEKITNSETRFDGIMLLMFLVTFIASLIAIIGGSISAARSKKRGGGAGKLAGILVLMAVLMYLLDFLMSNDMDFSGMIELIIPKELSITGLHLALIAAILMIIGGSARKRASKKKKKKKAKKPKEEAEEEETD